MLKKRAQDLSRVSCFKPTGLTKTIKLLKPLSASQNISKKGQLTIFIILGVIILFTFLFLIQMSSRFVISQLEQGGEDIFSKVFRKEGLRIFVEDCLEDELREAIILSGKQGRIWDDQPGGTLHFEAGFSGVQYLPDSESRIAYALTNYNYLTHKNAYPCASEENSPVFCQYFFPNTARFGEVQLWERNLENDLENYLKIKSQECIDNYLANLTARQAQAEFTSTDFKLEIDLQDEGILVKALYPLSFNVGGEDFFHLSVFDFFYPTKLRKMLRAVYFFPLEMDYRFADFNFTEATLTERTFSYFKSDGTLATRPTFKSDYEGLEVSMKRERISTEGNSYGDTIYTFTSPFPHILDTPDNYTLRFARENRAPALDYVHRGECLATENPYDYLIIKGDLNYGNVNIQLKAHDPDEDIITADGRGEEEIKYLFDDLSGDSSDASHNFGNYFTDIFFTSSAGAVSRDGSALLADQLIVSNEKLPNLPPGKYSFTAKSRDKYGQEDWQEVRVFVDRPIVAGRDLMVGINIPYLLGGRSYPEAMANLGPETGSTTNTYYITPEDPLFIQVTVPEDSAAESALTALTYTPILADGTRGTPREITLPEGAACVNLPSGDNNCVLTIYPLQLESWSAESGSIYQEMTTTLRGELEIKFSANYCGLSDEEAITSELMVTTEAKQCLPHENPLHPLPYVPGLPNYLYNEDGTPHLVPGTTTIATENIPPLEAAHVCCNDDYTFKQPEEGSCFVSPQGTCNEIIKGFNPENYELGYVAAFAAYNCSGDRGNVCGKDGIDHYGPSELNGEPQLLCGTTGRVGCAINTLATSNPDKIAQKCAGQPAYSYVEIYGEDGFCLGTMGCSEFCSSEGGKELVLDIGTPEQANNLNHEAITTFKLGNELLAQVHCGCTAGDVTPNQKKCDADFDPANGFEGRCQIDGSCR